ncbi:hypothetical protein [uncultured Mycobacterium sp.]|uniref:hypothetical protein n=1 Tax=uncultured Mycobacterium sp. TaxID=171292 RepID=UPI0035CA1165
MLVIVGLVVLLVAAIVGVTGVLNNAGAAHPLTENFAVFGYHVTGSTGTLFLFGIVIGALAMLGLSVLLAGARRTAVRGRDARRELGRSQREAAFANRDAGPAGPQAGEAVTPAAATTRRKRASLFGRWPRGPQPRGTAHVGGRR